MSQEEDVAVPRNPYDYMLKKIFSRAAKPFLEYAVGEAIVRYQTVEESHHRLELMRGASDLSMRIWTQSGRTLTMQIDFQKEYRPDVGERLAKYLLAEKQARGAFPLQILVCIEDFAHRFADGAAIGNPGEEPKMLIFFRAFNLSQLPAQWFVAEDDLVAIAMGLLCDRSSVGGEDGLLAMYERALRRRRGQADEDLGGFLITLQLSLQLGRINREWFRRFMDATYRDYGRELVHNLIFTNPEVYELFKPDLDAKYEEGKRDGFEAGKRDGFEAGKRDGFEAGKRDGFKKGLKRGERRGERRGELKTALSLYLSGVSAEQIFQATGLRPEDYLPKE
ncbi:MAG: hypothetical protein RMM53_03270 [Bacteroidia bacterium]|nr:hypothetical protein [Bacteroidia bacterium]